MSEVVISISLQLIRMGVRNFIQNKKAQIILEILLILVKELIKAYLL